MTALATLLAAARATRGTNSCALAWCTAEEQALLLAARDPALDEAVRELRGCVDLADQVQDAIANVDDHGAWDAVVEIKARIRAALGEGQENA